MVESKKKAPSADAVIRAKPFLVKAISKNDVKTLEKIMKAGFPIEEPIQIFMKQTPLMYAVSVSEPEILEALFKWKPNFLAQDSCGRTILHYCCRGGNVQNLRRLLKEPQVASDLPEMRSHGGVTPLMAAIQSGNIYLVGHCLNSGFDPFSVDNTGRSCIDYAKPFMNLAQGQNLVELIEQAQAQWRDQIDADQIKSRSQVPDVSSLGGPFAEFLADNQAIQNQNSAALPQADTATGTAQADGTADVEAAKTQDDAEMDQQ